MADTTLDDLNRLILECDRHHHFYHYKSSWQHLAAANDLRAKGDEEGARRHYKAALFQDHLNAQAKAEGQGPAYCGHIASGAIEALAAFERSLGWEADISMELCEQGRFEEALKISGARHDRYHQHASDAHVRRGQWFMEVGELDLAIADFSKALDLHRNNREALEARARAYRKKGNEAMARKDERMLAGLG